ncbi:ATP-binding protein [Caldivirga sp.]|uniref:AAA family ATPase n=1 Tax=Caldivirga sp. TaxID=2080243 RepID=UPI0025BD5831|nr:ATP-binding protein [Caldivirga sp.]
MLFNLEPKNSRIDLYDRDYELRELYDAVNRDEKIIVVYGVRRVGKTSLVKSFLSELTHPYVLIDVRRIYFTENSVSMTSLVKYMLNEFRGFMNISGRLWLSIKEILTKIKWIKVGSDSLEIRINGNVHVNLTELLDAINRWCIDNSTMFIIVLDEAQYMRFSNIRYDGVLAWAYDNLSNIKFIITGSEIGVLRDFLRLNDAKAPLYGRYVKEIYVDRFSRELSIDFLRAGFKELNVEVSDTELAEVYDKVDGVIGWLTLYGYLRGMVGLNHGDALSRVFEEGSKLVIDELSELIRPARARYLAILGAVAHGLDTWSEIKRYVEVKVGSISDVRFNELLRNLVRYGYLAKINDKYIIPDPMVKYTVLNYLGH